MSESNLSPARTARRLLLVVVTALIAVLTIGAGAAGPAGAASSHRHGHHHRWCHHHRHAHGCRHHRHHAGVTTTKRIAPHSGSTVPARSADEVRIGRALLDMLNRERREHHLPALSMDSHLQLSARRHDLAMAHTDDMSHQVSGEKDLGTRVSAAGYRWSWAGENIGWNSDMSQSGVLALEQMMYDEKPPNDGHRENILSTHYRNVGVDVYFDQPNHKVWLTTDFGEH